MTHVCKLGCIGLKHSMTIASLVISLLSLPLDCVHRNAKLQNIMKVARL